jgi:hypothetical protein
MRSTQIARLGIAILAAAFGLAVMASVALEPKESVQRAWTVASVTQPEESWLFNEDRVAVLVAEAITLLASVVGCGLLIAGMEALDIWSERRERGRAATHISCQPAAARCVTAQPRRDADRASDTLRLVAGERTTGHAASRRVTGNASMTSAGTQGGA